MQEDRGVEDEDDLIAFAKNLDYDKYMEVQTNAREGEGSHCSTVT